MEALREAGDLAGWGLQLLGWWRTFTNLNQRIPDDDEYERFASAAGNEHADVRAQLLMHRAENLSGARDPRDEEFGRAALALARKSDDVRTRAYALAAMGLILNRHLNTSESRQCFEEAITETEGLSNPRIRGWGRARIALPLVVSGRLSQALDACAEHRSASRGGMDLTNDALNIAVFHAAAILTGHRELVRELRAEGAIVRQRLAYPAMGFILDAGTAWHRMIDGEFEEARDALVSWSKGGGRSTPRSARLLCDLQSGEPISVRQTLAESPLRLAAGGFVDFTNVGPIAVAGDLAGELGDRQMADDVLALLLPLLDRGVLFSVSPPILLPRAAASAARAAGRFSLAKELLARAEGVVEDTRAHGEAGLVALEKVRLLGALGRKRVDIRVAAERCAQMLWRTGQTGALAGLLSTLDQADVPLKVASDGPEDVLSPTEREVLEQLGQGLTASTIADNLLLTVRTVEVHLSRLARRAGVTNPTEARAYLSRTTLAPPSGSKPVVRSELSELTARESEVLALVARGLTNQEIADELVISLHTAIRHVANILGKTGAANRTKAAQLLN
jgi:DNA-binding NarL/FixJ family response regulator